jgi:hypothetical protein
MDIYAKPTFVFTYDVAFLLASASGFASGVDGCDGTTVAMTDPGALTAS